MTYRIARGGQIFGPYTEAEVRQYIATGNIGLFDMVQPEAGAGWVPVRDLFPLPAAAPATPASVITAPSFTYPDPPDFPWWAVLVLGLVTTGVFSVVWDIVQASWLKRVERNSTAFFFYVGVAVLYLFKLPGILATMTYNVFGGPQIHTHEFGLGGLSFVLIIIARFVFRRELLAHFNQREGVPLRLNSFWTLVLGDIYFQYHFNRINQLKRAGQASVSAA